MNTSSGGRGQPPAFLWSTCQVGAERALKAEMGRRWPDFHFAYSRPGFLTFKLPPSHGLPDDFRSGAVFARASGFSLGKAAGEHLDQRVTAVWQLVADRSPSALHVWPRDAFAAGNHDFEPGIDAASRDAAQALLVSAPTTLSVNQPVAPGDLVLDCVLVEAGEWWVGYHRAVDVPSRWPGGIYQQTMPPDAVSRAYGKIEEALAWSELPVRAGDVVAEIGCAPGGASQALLKRGLVVLGVDPAEVDPRVLGHPRFTHLRKRGADVRRREFSDVRWLAADMNVAPEYTLTTVEAIVTHSAVHVAGLLLTLKLLSWDLADEIGTYLDRVAGWGFERVEARQLAHNRQEICVAALNDALTRKPGRH